jgi:hypothetical protein
MIAFRGSPLVVALLLAQSKYVLQGVHALYALRHRGSREP